MGPTPRKGMKRGAAFRPPLLRIGMVLRSRDQCSPEIVVVRPANFVELPLGQCSLGLHILENGILTVQDLDKGEVTVCCERLQAGWPQPTISGAHRVGKMAILQLTKLVNPPTLR